MKKVLFALILTLLWTTHSPACSKLTLHRDLGQGLEK